MRIFPDGSKSSSLTHRYRLARASALRQKQPSRAGLTRNGRSGVGRPLRVGLEMFVFPDLSYWLHGGVRV
jgi:hypothetical protein